MLLPGSLDLAQLSATELVLLLREELKQHLRAGSPVRVEELLAKWPGKISDEGILDLIYQEIVLREEAGEQPALDEYRQRFPHLDSALQRQFALHEMLKNSDLTSGEVSVAATVTVHENTPIVAAPSSRLDRKIRQYHLEKELGRGGMGVVYQARDEKLHRTVALKLLLGQEHASPELLSRFRVEAEILAQLQHPNIVQIFEIGEHEGQPFFAMEYVAGVTLQARVRENPLPALEAARLVHLLAEAMHSAHERGIIHRDLKPSNVLLSGAQIPKITDFGLARQGQSDITASGAILGTPSYMAPEQAQGQLDRIGPTTDVYALGAILFELVTGRAPFRGATVPSTLHQVLHNDPPSPRRLQPGIPLDLETICVKCLQKDPARRFVSAKALADDLQRFLRGEPIQARPIGRLETLTKWARREPKVAALAAAVLLVTVIGFLAVVYQWQAERHERQSKEEALLRETQALYFSSIALAERELEKGKVAWAESSLAKCPEYLRDWEWRHLAYRCQHGEPVAIKMPDKVISLATHLTQTAVVVGCSNGEIVILHDGQTKGTPILGHLGPVNWIAFAPDGSEFFSGGEDAHIQGWKLASGEKIKTFIDHEGPISCLAFHPQEPWIASTTYDCPDSGKVYVWDRQTLKRIHTLENHSARVTGLAFHPKGKLLASASHDQTITLWDCQSGQIVRVLRDHRWPIACVAFSPDGSLLASSASLKEEVKRPEDHETLVKRPEDHETFIWDTERGTVLHRLQGHADRAVAVAFRPDGKRLASAGRDHQAKLWDVRTGQEVLTLSGHRKGIWALGFNSQESLFTGSLDHTVRVWKTK
jgi:tRNA A-37 threonylcarbamoyl transferase component Bud32